METLLCPLCAGDGRAFRGVFSGKGRSTGGKRPQTAGMIQKKALDNPKIRRYNAFILKILRTGQAFAPGVPESGDHRLKVFAAPANGPHHPGGARLRGILPARARRLAPLPALERQLFGCKQSGTTDVFIRLCTLLPGYRGVFVSCARRCFPLPFQNAYP